jgi:hypothetical protein
MLIRDEKRIITADGSRTFRAFGIAINLHSRFFSGTVIIKFKYGYRKIDRKADHNLKHDVDFSKVRGLDTKFLEIRLVNIPKGK